jgi:hypothetical protein
VKLWALAIGTNFLLHILYLAAVTEGVAALLLWCKPRGDSGLSRDLAQRQQSMIPGVRR